MTPKHITIVYPITGQDHEEQLLAAGHWIASCHGDAMAERDALQGELENATAIAGMNATDRDVKARACLKLEAALAEMTRGYEAARLEIESLKKSLADSPIDADVQRDAERYRWLRKQQWRDGELCVVAQPKKSVKLGSDCKSLDRLDGFIDAARAAQGGV